MKIWKRNAVIATVLLFICAGVYLNWSYNNRQKTPDLTDTLNAEQVMGETSLQLNDAAEPVSLEETSTDDYLRRSGSAGSPRATARSSFSSRRLPMTRGRRSAIRRRQR